MIFSCSFLGIIGRESKQVFLFCVPDRKHHTIIPHILKHVHKGATIMSDKMSSYVKIKKEESKLEQYGFNHMWVNHSREFVHSYVPEVHTNNIERCWRSVRNSISTIKRTFSTEIVQQYLDCFVARSHFNGNQLFVFMLIALKTLKFHNCNI